MSAKNQAPETLRDQILTESVKILGSHGFEGLSLREIAKKLKVTHQAPYHYFTDKGALLIELKKTGFERLNQAMQQAVQSAGSEIEVLEKIGLTYFDFCMENPGYFRAMFAATSTGQGIRVAPAAEAFECLKQAIQNLQKTGVAKDRNTEILAMITWTYMHGFVALALEKYPAIGGKYKPRELVQKMIREMSALLGA